MHIFTSKTDLNNYISNNYDKNATIGFVPTMGALHQGHLSLLKQSLQNNLVTVVSIFVNPTQFNNPDDLIKYPRNLESDVDKIKSVSDKIIIFAPTVTDIYGSEIKSDAFCFDGLENQMEGKFRPGHFDGVGTVVKALFEIVKPTNAYFGEKDFQQLQIVKKLLKITKQPVNIISCAIFRESNGLAMSSRNERLTAKERENAALIFKTLAEAKILFQTQSAIQVKKFVVSVFEKENIIELEYFEIANEKTLKSISKKIKNQPYRAFIAVVINGIRLIDTISL